MTDTTRILDPICDMVVGIADARENGLSIEMSDREYAFCSAGCLTRFAKEPARYTAKVDAWLAAGGDEGHHRGGHDGAAPEIDAGMREWYKACRCCMHDAYPEIVEKLDAELGADATPPAQP